MDSPGSGVTPTRIKNKHAWVEAFRFSWPFTAFGILSRWLVVGSLSVTLLAWRGLAGNQNLGTDVRLYEYSVHQSMEYSVLLLSVPPKLRMAVSEYASSILYRLPAAGTDGCKVALAPHRRSTGRRSVSDYQLCCPLQWKRHLNRSNSGQDGIDNALAVRCATDVENL